MPATYSMQNRTKIVNPFLNRNNSDAKSSSSLPQGGNNVIHPGPKDLNTRSNKLLMYAQSYEVINNLKNLDKEETLKD